MARKARKLDEFKGSPSGFWGKFRKKISAKKLLAYVAFIFLLHSVFFGSFVAIARNLFISSAVFFDKISYCIVDGVRGVVYALSNDTYGIIFGLKKENLKLKNEVEQLANLKIENDELRKMLSMKERIDCDVCIARVLRSFSNDYVRSFILDLGESDGISLDDVVINNDGLIGRIVEVDQNWSKVMLITDTNSNVPVRASVTLAPFTASRSSETYVSDILTDGAASTGVNASAACTVTLVNAIAAGDNTNTLKIPMVYEDVSLKNGDIVETSGYGNVFHDRIPVGKVVEEENGTFCIVPFADFNAAEYVGVLKKNK
ncbi:cell shape-determining protein MreC [Alphaproteobacteria bacterium]|nr:cell shape-determining protein MreC [Alphaproteobacteria bacterium]